MTSSVTKMEVCDADLNVLAPHLTQVIHVSDLEEEASSTDDQVRRSFHLSEPISRQLCHWVGQNHP